MFSIEISKKAKKAIGRYDKLLAKRITDAIEKLSQDPFPRQAVKVKGGANVFRVRVGDYRILYEVYHAKNAILIVDVDKRPSVYETRF